MSTGISIVFITCNNCCTLWKQILCTVWKIVCVRGVWSSDPPHANKFQTVQSICFQKVQQLFPSRGTIEIHVDILIQYLFSFYITQIIVQLFTFAKSAIYIWVECNLHAWHVWQLFAWCKVHCSKHANMFFKWCKQLKTHVFIAVFNCLHALKNLFAWCEQCTLHHANNCFKACKQLKLFACFKTCNMRLFQM